MSYYTPFDTADGESSWFSSSNAVSRVVGFSFLTNVLQGLLSGSAGALSGEPGPTAALGSGPNSYLVGSLMLFMLGWIVEGGRRFFAWAIERFKPIQYSVIAQFTQGDPAYEWITLLLTEEELWNRSRLFRVKATSPFRSWSVKLQRKGKQTGDSEDYADFVPSYSRPQIFNWKGYLVEVSQALQGSTTPTLPYYDPTDDSRRKRLFVTIYTRDMSALSSMVAEARERYLKSSRPHVIVHTATQKTYGFESPWDGTKRKTRRPLSSIVLQGGVLDSVVDDAREFIETEEWYHQAGIPHRRGYLLYGPPGTGKTSTIYAIAGELGLEIYSLSLGSSFVDDEFLARAVASIPKQAILLIEDIDCAFPSREELEEINQDPDYYEDVEYFGMRHRLGSRRSSVTLSGLLNVLDGVGSEEGRLFFATSNYADRLDPALVRPGRIDKKVQYELSTSEQVSALFLRFYPQAFATLWSKKSATSGSPGISHSQTVSTLKVLAEQFASAVPEHKFSTAELQGFLLTHKKDPERAVEEIGKWVEKELNERAEREKREEERLAKIRERKAAFEAKKVRNGLEKLGVNVPGLNAGGPDAGAAERAPSESGDSAASDDTASESGASISTTQPTESEVGGPVPTIPPSPVAKPLVNGKGTAVDNGMGSGSVSPS